MTLKNSDKARLVYVRDENGFPVGCLAYRIERACTFAFSIYNPRDKFSKLIARDVTLGRLEKCPHIFVGNWHDCSYQELTARILEEIVALHLVDKKQRMHKRFRQAVERSILALPREPEKEQHQNHLIEQIIVLNEQHHDAI